MVCRQDECGTTGKRRRLHDIHEFAHLLVHQNERAQVGLRTPAIGMASHVWMIHVNERQARWTVYE